MHHTASTTIYSNLNAMWQVIIMYKHIGDEQPNVYNSGCCPLAKFPYWYFVNLIYLHPKLGQPCKLPQSGSIGTYTIY